MTASPRPSSGTNGLDDVLGSGHLPRFAGDIVAIGIAELDQLMDGGLDRGSANLFLGSAVLPVSEDDPLRAANPAFTHRSCGA